MLELLTGTGLALAAGLNAWIPLILLGALDRFTTLVELVRPTAGGLAFGSGVGSTTVAVTDPETFFTSSQWAPIAIGVVLVLGVHVAKAAARPVINASTAGVGAPVASTAEDIGSVTLAVAAILAPVLVIIGLAIMVTLVVVVVRRRRERRRRADAASAGPA